jgi:hypothetical protein
MKTVHLASFVALSLAHLACGGSSSSSTSPDPSSSSPPPSSSSAADDAVLGPNADDIRFEVLSGGAPSPGYCGESGNGFQQLTANIHVSLSKGTLDGWKCYAGFQGPRSDATRALTADEIASVKKELSALHATKTKTTGCVSDGDTTSVTIDGRQINDPAFGCALPPTGDYTTTTLRPLSVALEALIHP